MPIIRGERSTSPRSAVGDADAQQAVDRILDDILRPAGRDRATSGGVTVDPVVVGVLADAVDDLYEPGTADAVRRLVVRSPALDALSRVTGGRRDAPSIEDVVVACGRRLCPACLPPLRNYSCALCGDRRHAPVPPVFSRDEWLKAMARVVPGDTTPDPLAGPTAYGFTPPDEVGMYQGHGVVLVRPIGKHGRRTDGQSADATTVLYWTAPHDVTLRDLAAAGFVHDAARSAARRETTFGTFLLAGGKVLSRSAERKTDTFYGDVRSDIEHALTLRTQPAWSPPVEMLDG